MSNWQKVPFDSLFLTPTRNGIYKTAEFHGRGTKVVNMGELFANDRIGKQSMERIELTEQEKRISLLEEGDLLFARRSLVESGAGKAAIVTELPEETTFESSVIRVRLDQQKCNPLFYLYWFRSYNGRSAIMPLVTGVNVKGIRGSDLAKIMVDYPTIEIQNRIASFLSDYDDLIETNQYQIKLLEEAAQRLYKEWFVDLRFPGHENVPVVEGVPEGWTKCTLDDVIDFNPKVILSKDRMKECVPMSALSTQAMTLDSNEFTTTTSNSGSKFQNGDTLLARITPCLENGKTGFVAGIVSEEGAVGSTEFIVMRSKNINPYMVYLLARTEDFRKTAINSMTGSDGRQRAQPDKIKAYPYILPSRRIIESFAEIVSSVFEEIEKKNFQNKKLSEARDRLLPKLMSGEIAV